MRYELRPMDRWTDPETADRQSSGVFRATWDSTINMLGYETEQLGADLVVIAIDVQAGDLRRDGMLRSRAAVGHPGVAVSFQSRFGPLRYATDRYESQWSGSMPGWQANVRAVALGLQALRAVDRYGITRTGEQYRGWSALPAARAGTSEWFPGQADAQRWMRKCAGEYGFDPEVGYAGLYRLLAKQMHPDKAGDRELWDRLDSAASVLGLKDKKGADHG